METNKNINNEFKNSSQLTQWVKFFLYLQIAIAVISLVFGYLEYQLFSDLKNGVYTSQEQANIDNINNANRQSLIAIVYAIIFIISAVLILTWIYRANVNTRKLGATDMEFTPGWSIGWYFIPIATLWMPYRAMQEIWLKSHALQTKEIATGTVILQWWWFLWLSSAITNNYLIRFSFRVSSIDEYIHANMITQAADFMAILLALITLTIITKIYSLHSDVHLHQSRQIAS